MPPPSLSPELRTLIETVIVPTLLERFLAEHRHAQAPEDAAPEGPRIQSQPSA
ncbi:MAG TPA: hypothetical protein VK595_05645 [Vicinamibacterales bacterium]|nr:hypothetical protein [Vicinamibacterales bacterium]